MVERQIAQGLRNIAKQREIVAGLQSLGADATKARALLTQFEEAQAGHEADQNRLKSKLGLA